MGRMSRLNWTSFVAAVAVRAVTAEKMENWSSRADKRSESIYDYKKIDAKAAGKISMKDPEAQNGPRRLTK
jgi:hypothetical protein